jgi:UDP-glucuronate 4-epimerase
VFNYGKLLRDFTFIDDIVEGVVRLLVRPPSRMDGQAPFSVFNIGNSSPVELRQFIASLQEVIGIDAILEMMPMQPGDVPATFADVGPLEAAVGFRPRTELRDGLTKFFEWYRSYYREQNRQG